MLNVWVQSRVQLPDEEELLVQWAGAPAPFVVPDQDSMPGKEEPQPSPELNDGKKPERRRGQVPAVPPPSVRSSGVAFDQIAELQKRLHEAEAKLDHQQELSKARKQKYRKSPKGKETHAVYMRGWRAKQKRKSA